MSLAVQDGVLIAKDGSLGTGSECCCVQGPPCEGTCCIEGVCSQSTKADCIAAGGTFYKCEESCSAGYCTSPPSCETLGCAVVEWDTAIVTIEMDTFEDVRGDTQATITACTNDWKAIWQSKVEDLDGTYTLSYAGTDGFGNPYYSYTSGTAGTTGYLEVKLTLSDPTVSTGVACAQKAVVSISLINLDENGPELYEASAFPFLCINPGQLYPRTGNKVAATTASSSNAPAFYVDLCDGVSLSATTRVAGSYSGSPSCRTFECYLFQYSGAASVTLTNA